MRSRITRHLRSVLGDAPAADAGPPLELAGRDYAIFLLRLAAEIEHGLMVQYLFAAYSLGGPDLTAQQQTLVGRWQQTILGVAKEEMGHLVTVQNVLTALGGPLQFNREDYPHDNVLYDTGFRLRPLDLGSLATYVVAESPADWDDAQARAIKTAAQVETGGVVNRVGRLYEEIIRVIADPQLVSDSTFDAGSEAFQASWDEWGRGFRRGEQGRQAPDDPDAGARDVHELVIVTVSSRATALDALRQVGEQGEGFDAPANEDESHFQRFLAIYEALDALGADERAAVVRPLATNPTTDLAGPDVGDDPADSETTSAIANPQARLWAHLFNVRYRKLLVSLSHAFELADDPSDLAAPNPRGTLIHRAFAEMYHLRSIAGQLVVLPLDDARPDDERAGPPFQMPYSLMLPHDEADRWRLHRDMLDASATLAQQIAAGAAGRGADYLTALEQADATERAQVELSIAGGPG